MDISPPRGTHERGVLYISMLLAQKDPPRPPIPLNIHFRSKSGEDICEPLLAERVVDKETGNT